MAFRSAADLAGRDGAVAFGWLLLGFLDQHVEEWPRQGRRQSFPAAGRAPSPTWPDFAAPRLRLARLAVQESSRRACSPGWASIWSILAFAIWFLDPKSNDPATLYLSFVLTATTYLILIMALFLSAFSLPADIKSHTIYTIVTKPVRPCEIVLGTDLGFSVRRHCDVGRDGPVQLPVRGSRLEPHARASLQRLERRQGLQRLGRPAAPRAKS